MLRRPGDGRRKIILAEVNRERLVRADKFGCDVLLDPPGRPGQRV